MSNLSLPRHKVPAGMDMKRAREAMRLHKGDLFKEPVNGVMPPAVFEGFAAVACFGDEKPPEGFCELKCDDFASRVYVPVANNGGQ
jgi:hypothetical protein